MDVRFEDQVQEAVRLGAERFGGIDILVNNASAIFLAGTADTPMKRFDLMHSVNVRGTFLATQTCLPYLKRRGNPHVLNLSPPLNVEAKWFAPHVAYTMSKFGMSLCVLGMAEEFRDSGVAVNALWPRTVIATAAVQNLLGGDEVVRRARRPEIVADAAHHILTQPSRDCTGNFFVDEDVLRSTGVTDFAAVRRRSVSRTAARLLRVTAAGSSRAKRIRMRPDGTHSPQHSRCTTAKNSVGTVFSFCRKLFADNDLAQTEMSVLP